MKRIVLAFCLVLLFTACTHTVVGGQHYSPNGENVFVFESHGASGRSYLEVSKKRVYYSVIDKGSGNTKILLKGDFKINAGDLDAEIIWDSNKKLEANFYETNGDSRKNLKSLSIVRNEAGEFTLE